MVSYESDFRYTDTTTVSAVSTYINGQKDNSIHVESLLGAESLLYPWLFVSKTLANPFTHHF